MSDRLPGDCPFPLEDGDPGFDPAVEHEMAALQGEIDDEVRAESRAVDDATPEQPAQDKPVFRKGEVERALDDNFLGDARLLQKMLQGKFVFDNTMGQWYRYNCVRWIYDKERTHLIAVTELAKHYKRHAVTWAKKYKEGLVKPNTTKESLKPVEKRRDAFNKRAMHLKDPARVEKVLKFAGTGGFLGLSGDEWNRNPYLFAAANVAIDLRTGKSFVPSPDDYLNMASSVEWKGLNAECEEWDKFVDQIFEGDQELVEYIQKVVGYWLTGLQNIQEFWCFWGKRGRNGKGVFFRTLRCILGDYYTTIGTHLLMERKESDKGPNPELLDLRDRRLFVASEAKKKDKFNDERIKALSGGDPIKTRGLYSGMVEFISTGKLLFVTNRLPQVDADEAFKARMRVIPFDCHFKSSITEPDPETKTYPLDPFLEERLQTPENLSGILAWCVRGAVKLLENMDLTPPACVTQQTDEYFDDHDLVGNFISQCLHITQPTLSSSGKEVWPEESKTKAGELYDAFKFWCHKEKRIQEKYIMSLQAFSADMKSYPKLRRVPPKNFAVYNVVVKMEWKPAEANNA